MSRDQEKEGGVGTMEATDKAQGGDGKDRKDRLAKIDFKMVTFSLAGKDYGIDIMGVKEIAKANRFTYVPNTAPFVRGVYNLRGEIISVIDLRTMFHLPAERKSDEALENLLILQIQEHVFGIIVDSIDKVIGVASENIQPPHPIFGDINVKYIRGVVENQGRLYIILDIAKVFAPRDERSPEEARTDGRRVVITGAASAESPAHRVSASVRASGKGDSIELEFIKETLSTFKRFGSSPINEEWVKARFPAWKAERKKDIQLRDAEDADLFLQGFYSPHTGEFWGEDYVKAMVAALPELPGKTVSAWNPGCGRGYESYSFAVALRIRYPEARIRVWANDADLLCISMAPNLALETNDLSAAYQPFIVGGKGGYSFNAAIRDSVSFEYHDILNGNPVPEVDFILCRDMVSFMSPQEQSRVLEDFGDKLKNGGRVFMGANETLAALEGWKAAEGAGLPAFEKKD
jgi:purine-binding chemotaxis protein CheW